MKVLFVTSDERGAAAIRRTLGENGIDAREIGGALIGEVYDAIFVALTKAPSSANEAAAMDVYIKEVLPTKLRPGGKVTHL